jgi:hypothetical protein
MSFYTRVLRGLALTAPTALLLLLAGSVLIGAEGKKPAAPATKLDAADLAKMIDKIISSKLTAEKITPSARTDDAEFCRRVHLDLTGKIPTVEATTNFLASTDPKKREKLIDDLLASPDYGRHMADLWQTQMLPKNSDNRRLTSDGFHKYLEKNFNDNMPWDKFVTDLLTSKGTQDEHAAVTYFLANNTVDKMTDSVAKLFLGLQLQCAQCHHHPFTEWKQSQYWETAAFFMKVQVANVNKAAKNGNSPGVEETAQPKRGKNGLPESAKVLDPKFLDGVKPNVKGAEALRPILAKWICTPENHFFSKALVNRAWAQLFGRGFVNPIDDLRDENEPSHPDLFAAMAQQFALNGFDIKFMFKAICLSETYQRTSKPSSNNRDVDPTLFSRMNIKVLSPEQLYDSFEVVFGATRGERPAQGKGPAGAAGRLGPATGRAAFVNFFNLDENWDPMDFQAGIPQVLRMMNSAPMNNAARSAELTKAAKTPSEAIEMLYLAALSREPTEAEIQRALAYAKKGSDNKQALADLLWVLVNSSEFALNH